MLQRGCGHTVVERLRGWPRWRNKDLPLGFRWFVELHNVMGTTNVVHPPSLMDTWRQLQRGDLDPDTRATFSQLKSTLEVGPGYEGNLLSVEEYLGSGTRTREQPSLSWRVPWGPGYEGNLLSVEEYLGSGTQIRGQPSLSWRVPWKWDPDTRATFSQLKSTLEVGPGHEGNLLSVEEYLGSGTRIRGQPSLSWRVPWKWDPDTRATFSQL